MTTTFATLVSDTERHLLAGDRDELNSLAASVTDTATTLTYTYDSTAIAQGSYLAIDLEIVYVWDVDESARSATVQRGMVGSTAAAHNGGQLVYINPKFSKYDIANALNVEIRDLSSAGSGGLFRVADFQLTTQPVARTYAVPADALDMLEILDIRYLEPGAEMAWVRADRYVYDILRSMPAANFPSGMAIRLERPVYPGRVMNVVYAKPFAELVNLSDVVTAVTGMPATAVDIPPLGAAARLMGVREAKRSFVESEVDTRRASEVPVGAATRAAQTLLQLLNARIQSEVSTLRQAYPNRK